MNREKENIQETEREEFRDLSWYKRVIEKAGSKRERTPEEEQRWLELRAGLISYLEKQKEERPLEK